MEKFFKNNYKTIIFVLFLLFSIKSFQSCLRKTKIDKVEKNMTQQCDSLVQVRLEHEKELLNEVQLLKDSVKSLVYELKVAGVKAYAAEERARAIQTTAEKIKTNTTIKIEQEKDTLK